MEFTLVEKSLGGVYNMVAWPRKVFVDGTSNSRGARIGIVIVSPATNNEAEYYLD